MRDKLVAFDKVEKTMHKKLDPSVMGPKRRKDQSYYEAIQRKQKPEVDMSVLKLGSKKPINTYHDDGKVLHKKLAVAKVAQRDQMIHSYRERLFTRFKV